MKGIVREVCVVKSLVPVPGRVGVSAIDKRPVDGPVKVRDLGLFADVQADREHHGGLEKAVYAYSDESMAIWEKQLGRTLPAGHFGENLRTFGFDVDGALIGEQWSIGTVRFQVSTVRTPCRTFAEWMGIQDWVKTFQSAALPGAYLRVLEPGSLRAGDPIEVVARPSHGVPVSRWFAEKNPDDARALLNSAERGEFIMGERLLAHCEASLKKG